MHTHTHTPLTSPLTGSATAKPTTVLPEIYQLLRDPATVTASHSTTLASPQHESIATTSIAATSSSAEKIAVSASEQTPNTMAAPSSVIVQAKSHHQTDSAAIASGTCSDSIAVKRSGDECTTSELVHTDKSKPRLQDCESPSNKSHCNSPDPDDREIESSTLSSNHAEDEGDETDTCSFPPSGTEEVDTGIVKKQKFS